MMLIGLAGPALGQLTDRNKAVNTANSGIAKTLAEEIGVGRGDIFTPDSSLYIIARDPFRAIRRGRQLFQRKFSRYEGQGPLAGDGVGNINVSPALGAGLADSCAACHGRPRGAAGFGGDVATRPDSRDAPHLFGLGLVEQLADEITFELRSIASGAMGDAARSRRAVNRKLEAKGISYGSIRALPDGSLDMSRVQGVRPDLRIRPFFANGGEFSMRAFIVGALADEMGLQAVDPDLLQASSGQRVVTPSGLVLDGRIDTISPPPVSTPGEDADLDGVANEIPTSLVDFLEFYLLNYFKPATYEQTPDVRHGLKLMEDARCTDCHTADLRIDRDRRIADVETTFDPVNGIFNDLFSVAQGLFNNIPDARFPSIKVAQSQPFVVRNIFADFKLHDLGPNFWERNYDGTIQKEFMTEPLWGVGTTAPYGHDGRSINLEQVILRHGGEAEQSRRIFDGFSRPRRMDLIAFLQSLVVFPPDDTASNLNPGDPYQPGFPQFGHGSINLGALFNDPSDPE